MSKKIKIFLGIATLAVVLAVGVAILGNREVKADENPYGISINLHFTQEESIPLLKQFFGINPNVEQSFPALKQFLETQIEKTSDGINSIFGGATNFDTLETSQEVIVAGTGLGITVKSNSGWATTTIGNTQILDYTSAFRNASATADGVSSVVGTSTPWLVISPPATTTVELVFLAIENGSTEGKGTTTPLFMQMSTTTRDGYAEAITSTATSTAFVNRLIVDASSTVRLYSPFTALVAGQAGNLGYLVESSVADASSTVSLPIAAVQRMLLGPNTPISIQLYPYVAGDGYDVELANLFVQPFTTATIPIVGTSTVRFYSVTGELFN